MMFSPVGSLPRRSIRRSGPLELWLFVVAYVAYNGSRWIITGHETIAQANTRSIVALERSLGIAVEGGVQRLFSGDSVTGRRRLLALVWDPLVTLAVIATGNHFVVEPSPA